MKPREPVVVERVRPRGSRTGRASRTHNDCRGYSRLWEGVKSPSRRRMPGGPWVLHEAAASCHSEAMSQTDATEPDSERYLSGEGDSNQLPREDTLLERGVDDILDEGYSPPDYPRSNHYGETPYEEIVGESLAQRLAEEEPDVWVSEGRPPEPHREPDRAGRLVENDDTWRHQDVFATDAGVAGGAASAEEAAMHVVDPDAEDADGEDYDEDGGGEGEPERRP